MRNESQANVSLRSEAYANQALAQSAHRRAEVTRVLGAATLRPLGSKVVTRHNHQRVNKKQQTLATVSWICVTLSLSAFIGCLLAY